MTNLVKNARESIETRLLTDASVPGEIQVSIKQTKTRVTVSVADNGIGLPDENRSRLTEPYMTTREKGTGLGLAIVTRIMEEHSGRLTLSDAPASFHNGRGACVSLEFKKAPEDDTAKSDQTNHSADGKPSDHLAERA
jgi:two-component system nitrogen regulation sensor histidine kinase NtrY